MFVLYAIFDGKPRYYVLPNWLSKEILEYHSRRIQSIWMVPKPLGDWDC